MSKTEKNRPDHKDNSRPEKGGNVFAFWQGPLEALVIAGLILAAGYLLNPSDIGFLTVSPHPFWIAIVLVSARFNLVESLAASLLISVLYVLLVVLPGSSTYTYSSLTLFSDFREPVLFLAVSAVYGLNRNRIENFVLKLEEQLNEREAKLKDAELKRQAADMAVQQLENRITGQFDTVIDLFDMVSATRNMKIPEVKLSLLRAVKQHLSADQVILFDMEKGKLVPQMSTGKSDGLPESEDPLSDPVIARALETRGLAFVSQLMSKENSGRSGNAALLAGPLLDSSGHPCGLVAIYKMPFLQYNPYSFKLFRTMLNWWGKVLDEKQIIENLKSKSMLDEESGLFTYSYFSSRIEQEFARAKQHFIPLSVGLIRIEDFNRIVAEKRDELRSILSRIINRMAGEFVMVSEFKEDNQFAITFPIMAAADSDEVIRNIVAEIERFDFHPYTDSGKRLALSFYTADFSIEMESHHELLADLERGIDSLSRGSVSKRTYSKALEPFKRQTVDTEQLFQDFLGGFSGDGEIKEKQKLEQSSPKLSAWILNFMLYGGILRVSPSLGTAVGKENSSTESECTAIQLYQLFKKNLFETLDQLGRDRNFLRAGLSESFRERLESISPGGKSEGASEIQLKIFRELHPDETEYLGVEMRENSGIEGDRERIMKDESLHYEISVGTRPTRHSDHGLKESLGAWGER